MSFILDALKKSETERQRADAPALYEVKMAPARQGVAVWLIVVAGLLVINIVVLAVVLLHGTHGTPQVEATNVVAPAAAPVAAAPAVAAPAPAAAAITTVPTAPAPTPAAPPPASATRQTDDDAPAVDPARAPASVADADVPSYQEAASAPGANLPELKLDLHSYAANPNDRFVFLNMVSLREGQTSPAGVRVESITPDGVILSWHGSKFFLQSQ